MDRSSVKKISFILRKGNFSATKTKVTGNCLKWIDPVYKSFPHPGGGLFCHNNQRCSKLPEMDRSSVKNFPHWGGLTCHKNQSYWKLPEMDRSSLKKIPHLGGVEGFSATKTKVAGTLTQVDRSSVKKIHSWGGRGDFSATKTKVAGNCLTWIGPV